jgi:ATPase subunit of ABC transporter with duplicated ATPase domains
MHYSGTVVVVSHDRLLRSRFQGRTITLENGQIAPSSDALGRPWVGGGLTRG